MKRRMAALLGGTAAVMTLSAAQAMVLPASPTRPLAAKSYADLLVTVPNAIAALKVDDLARAQAPTARMQLAQYHHHHHHHHHGGFFPGAALGAVIGGMLAAPYYAPPPPPAYEAPPPYDSGVAWCIRHYRSYDPESGTYLGYDGYRHPCP